ncbi:glycosyltransferase [Flavobacterium ardleyense]|uniref:Glycosyltransferase n=1 Tax=Flavobacterium ardleyense TaxID=2038737 RepID=A0ABW5ZCH2_9FLAO
MKNNLAIVIPYYKIDFFKETLDSLKNQTNKNFNVYIGNDASLNNPEELLATYLDKLNITYHYFDKNLGSKSLVQQWNRCLALVQNEKWLMILGDDDVLASNVVASFYENIEEIELEGSLVIRFASEVINENSKKITTVFTHPEKENGLAFLERKLKGGTRSSLSEYIFNKKELLKIGIKDLPLAWYSDLLLVIELSVLNPIFSIDKSVVYFRNSGQNITSRKDNLVKKNEGTFGFYLYLIQNYQKQFSNSFLKVLYFNLEKTILDNKRQLQFWIKIFNLYVVNGRFLQFASLLIKAIKRVL